VYVFGDGEDAKVFIASADLMTRNTERRMEVGVEIIDASIKKQLIAYVDFYMNDSVKGRMMSSKGDFIPIPPSTTSVQDVQNQLLYNEISSILKA
jgi:polyphosphate kinase